VWDDPTVQRGSDNSLGRWIRQVVVRAALGATMVTTLVGAPAAAVGVATNTSASGPVPTARTGGAALAAAPTGEPISSHLVVGMATDATTGGYWLVASDGGIFSFDAPFHGSAGALPLARPVVGAASTPDGGGYWLVASDGGVFSYGNATFYGSLGGQHLNQPIVGMAATPDGGGYWLVAADGGIFAFGDAPFLGSTGSMHLNRPVVGMAATPDGHGYWLVASDGGIFAFGDAPFLGSTGSMHLNRPVVGMAATPDGLGYWLVASDGGLFTFGAPFDGAATGLLRRGAVAVSTGEGGYRIVAADGSVYTFGGAPFYGSAYVPPMVGEIVAIDPGHDGGNAAAPGFIDQPIDGGNFTEPCDTVGTETASGYPEHAFNFDVGIRLEALLQSEGATVVMTRLTDSGVGPCVDVRAAIANAAGADAAISIHADGGPVTGSGFDVIQPAPVVSPTSNNTAIVPASALLASAVRSAFGSDTGEPPSDYAGSNGIDERDNLGGLNLTTVPKVLIECANMQNPADAALTESPQWRQQAAQGLADGITAFLVAQQVP
jgi:N-acetylmuramoyl-L-alanine amidase